jgi:hypothetical protein
MPRKPNKEAPSSAIIEDEDDFENTGFYEWDGIEDDQSVIDRMSELARDNPKAALGAGLALVAGAIASIAWPFVRSKGSSKPAERKKSATKRRSAASRTKASGGAARTKKPTTRKTATRSAGSGGRKKLASGKTSSSTTGASATTKRTGAAKRPGRTATTRKPRSDKGTKRSRGAAEAANQAEPTN